LGKKEISTSDWQVIDAFFDDAIAAHTNGEMTAKQLRFWLTHYVGLAANEGIDTVVKGLQNARADVAKNGWGGAASAE
jgi:hypothetical protein